MGRPMCAHPTLPLLPMPWPYCVAQCFVQSCSYNHSFVAIVSGGSREYSLYSNQLPLLAGCLDFVIAALALRHNAKLPPVVHVSIFNSMPPTMVCISWHVCISNSMPQKWAQKGVVKKSGRG